MRVRMRDSGVTLVEVLIVLALIGVLAGVAALSFGSLDRQDAAMRASEQLVAHIERAVDHALTSHEAFALEWDEDRYQLLLMRRSEWVSHVLPELAGLKLLPSNIRLKAQGAVQSPFVTDGSLVPESMDMLRLLLSSDVTAKEIVFDGFSVQVDRAKSE